MLNKRIPWRSILLVLALLIIALVLLGGKRSVQDSPPSIVLIHVDDLGWTDLSVQGSTFFETPHIDALASSGIRFTNGYAAAAICSPSRAAVMTGRYPARIGITDWIRAVFQGGDIPEDGRNPTEYIGEEDKQLLVPPNPLWLEHEEETVAERLQDAGYVTAHIGKWHLGAEPWYPGTQGFDVNIGGCDYGQPPSYFDPYCRENQGCIPTLEPRREGEYLTDREADEAVAFIRAHQHEPFFLHMAHYAVHTPIQAKEDLTAYYEDKPVTNQDDAEYAAMVHSVDRSTGRIMDALEAAGIADNTIVVFTSDNGGLEGPTDNAPLRSGKGYPYEGGLRVPFIVHWPEEVPSASVSHEPVMGIDWLPTLLEAAGVSGPAGREVDGVSLVEHMRSGGRSEVRRESLFWHFPHYRQGHRIPPYSIVRRGDWKLIKWWEQPDFELYDLQADIGETTNLAEERPDLVEDLDSDLSDWLEATGAHIPRANPGYTSAAE